MVVEVATGENCSCPFQTFAIKIVTEKTKRLNFLCFLCCCTMPLLVLCTIPSNSNLLPNFVVFHIGVLNYDQDVVVQKTHMH